MKRKWKVRKYFIWYGNGILIWNKEDFVSILLNDDFVNYVLYILLFVIFKVY